MQALRVPAARGWGWLNDGFRIFRRNPPLLTFLIFSYWFLLLVLSLLPFRIGEVAALVLVPALSVGIMNGCRAIDRHQLASPSILFSGFQQNRATLLVLGAVYFVVMIAILGLTSLLDDGELARVLREPPGTVEPAADGRLLMTLQVMFLLTVPFLLAFWFSPMLAAWHDLSVGKALFFSLAASLRNWRAFLVYGVGIVLLSFVLPALILMIGTILAGRVPQLLQVLLSVPLIFVFVPTLYASFYVSYRDVFAASPGEPSAAA